MPGQLDPLTSDFQGVAVGKCHLWHRPGRVVVPPQEPRRVLVPDADDALEQGGRGAVVGVVVGVNQVGDGVAQALGGGNLVDCPLQVVADGRGRVEQHHAVRGGQERRVVDAVGDPVQVPLDAADVIALIVQGWAER